MAELKYNDDQIKKASWPLPENDQITSKIPTKSMDFKGNRYYYNKAEEDPKNRDYLMSVTTWLNVLSKGIGFNMWLGNATSFKDAMSYANERALIGNQVHAMCMWLIWGRSVDTSIGWFDADDNKIKPIPDESKLRLSAFIDFVDQYKPIPIATEISLYTNEKDKDQIMFPFAGTADQIMMIDGETWLIDIKTGAEYKKEQQLQLTAYKILYDHLYGGITGTIDQVACLYLTTRGKFRLKKYKFVPEAWNDLLRIGEYYFSDMRGGMPKVMEKEKLPIIYTLKEEEEDGIPKEGNIEDPKGRDSKTKTRKSKTI